jgi:hypothetical protein
MPLTRYFLYVGSVLLALLFVADAYLSKLPVADTSGPHLPVIRIHSERRGPERVVFDTRMVIPAPNGSTAASVPAPAVVNNASVSPRNAFAQMRPSDPDRVRSSGPKMPEPKQPRSRRIANHHAAQNMRVVWRQPQFGWFVSQRIW